jgi:hypothetical protein
VKLSKNELRGRLEEHLWKQLPDSVFEIKWVKPSSLLTWNRLDIAMRTLYLELEKRLPALADQIYYQDVRAQSLGALVDPDNAVKNSFPVYKEVFCQVSEDVLARGFDAGTSIIPVSRSRSLLNGGHRVSSALFHGKDVAIIETELREVVCGYEYFWDRGVSKETIEHAVTKIVSLVDNAFVAFLWPSGISKIPDVTKLFDRVVYKKQLNLSEKGKLNLLSECYRHMDWVGSERSGFVGLKEKLVECFPNSSPVTMVVFQSPRGVEEARELKQNIRSINGIGYSSIHITDDAEETLRLVQLLCNDNGLHFLNHAQLVTEKNLETIRGIRDAAISCSLSFNDFAVDGSWLLELYGLRRANDIDILSISASSKAEACFGYESREREIVFHGKPATEVVLDPANFFWWQGVKFVSFQQLRAMKMSRSEPKDLVDVKLMHSASKSSRYRRTRLRLWQEAIFLQVRLRKKTVRVLVPVLKRFHLHSFVRTVYWRYREPGD